MSNFSQKIIRIFFPQKCELCGKIIPVEKEKCLCYEEGIKRLSGNFCDTCGQDKDNCICTENQIKLNHITAPFSYSGFIKKYIHAFKFGGKKHFYRKLGKEMSHRFVVSYPGIKADTVTFVPLSEKSYSERGYNQSELLAKEVAKNLSVSFQPLLKKIRETEKQHLLSASKRRTNLENAFCLNGNADIINGKTIILCDDIKTTGYTFYICSEMLLKSGAKDVYCLSAAISEFESLPF